VDESTLEDMESTELIFIFGNNPGTNHPRMLTSLQKAKDHGAKVIAVNPLPEVSMMRVTNPNPQDYSNPLELPFALLGKGQALPICISPCASGFSIHDVITKSLNQAYPSKYHR
jgi:hypothetical protein